MIPARAAAGRNTRNVVCRARRRRGRPTFANLQAELEDPVIEEVDEVLERLELGAGRMLEPEIRALLQKYPRHHSTQFAMGVYLAMVRQDYAGSLPYLERAVQIYPPFPEAALQPGNSARKLGDIPKAVRAFRAALRYAPADDRVAELAAQRTEVLDHRTVLKGSPLASLDAYLANNKLFDQAFACLAQQDYEQAARLFNRVLAENPGHVQSTGTWGWPMPDWAGGPPRWNVWTRRWRWTRVEPARINRPGIEQMREGEPFRPAGMREVNFYSEKLEREKST